MLWEDTILAESSVNVTTKPGCDYTGSQGAGTASLIEKRTNHVADFEFSHFETDNDDSARPIRARNPGQLDGERLLAISNNKVTVVERYGLDLHKRIIIAKGWDRYVSFDL